MDNNQLWLSFATECQGYLEAIEEFLFNIEQTLENVDSFSGDVQVVFRSYHSLKGVSGAMGLQSVADLAHCSEDILGLVRQGAAAIDAATYRLLYMSYESLSVMIASAAKAQQDVPAAESLVAALVADFARLQAATGGADGASDAAEDADVSEEEEMLDLYCETARESLDRTHQLLSGELDAEAKEEIAETFTLLSEGAETLNMEEFAKQLVNFIAVLEEPERVQAVFSEDIVEQFALIFDIAGQDSWKNHDKTYYINGLKELDADIKQMQTAQNALKYVPEDQEDVAFVLSFANEAKGILQPISASMAQLSGLLLGLELHRLSALAERFFDVMSNIQSGQFVATNEVFSVFVEYRKVIAVLVQQDPDAPVDASETELSAVTERIERLLDYILDFGLDDQDEGTGVSSYDINESFLSILTKEQTIQITDIAETGGDIQGVHVFPERDFEVARGFLDWLNTNTEVITNRTLFEGDETGFEFLFHSPLDAETLEKQVRKLDVDARIVENLLLYEFGKPEEKMPFLRGDEGIAAIGGSGVKESFLRVPVESLERLTDFAHTILRSSHLIENMAHTVSDRVNDGQEAVHKVLSTSPDIDASIQRGLQDFLAKGDGEFRQITEEITSIRRRLQDIVEVCTDMRMVPLDRLLSRLSRSARMVSDSLGKKVMIKVTGDKVNVDNTLNEIISESLTHLVRNAIDHGLEMPEERDETGKGGICAITIHVLSRGEELWISIEDDGRGINRARIIEKALEKNIITQDQVATLTDNDILGLISRSDFSTSETVTEVSGRGVGMEVVHNNVRSIGGSLQFKTALGVGTKFNLRLPLQSSLQNVLLFKVEGALYGIQSMFVRKIIDSSILPASAHKQYVLYADKHVQALHMQDLLQINAQAVPESENDQKNGLVIGVNEDKKILIVDQIIGQQQVHLQKSNIFFSLLPYVQKAVVIGMQDIVLILDVFKILNSSDKQSDSVVSDESS